MRCEMWDMRYENVGQRPKVLANRAPGQVIFVLCFGCKVAVHWGAREIEVYYACQRVILVEAMILWLHSLLLRGSPVDLAAGHENSTSFGLCLTSRQRRKMWPCLRCVLPILRLLSIWATSREACGSEKLLAAAWGFSGFSRLNEGVNVKDPREENGDAVSRHIRPKLETSDIGGFARR